MLGDFGTGKTFLLHEIARQMPERLPPLTPVLVEMRSLEKGHPLDVLVSMHMVATGESRFDTEAFRYMLREGRVALLFDGFDELALRVTYERAAEHLETLVAAAEGRAKVIVTSRTSHFLSEAQAKQKLYEKVESVAGKRLVRNEGFDSGQMHRFLMNYYAQRDQLDADRARQAADERMDLIRDIQDLLGLSANPRMLSFIADLSHDDLLQARDAAGKITSAQLYQQLLDRWLKGEVKRRAVTGGVLVLAEQHLWDAVTSLALRIWQSGQRSVHVDELTDQIASRDPRTPHAEHDRGRGSTSSWFRFAADPGTRPAVRLCTPFGHGVAGRSPRGPASPGGRGCRGPGGPRDVALDGRFLLGAGRTGSRRTLVQPDAFGIRPAI